ncbi:MAG: TIM barrel protein [Kiritimatiellia bacterium]
MDIALTTRWNAGRHTDGAAMIDEILAMGFTSVELGYDTRLDLVEGVKRRVAEGAVRVNSVHNFCPVPMGAPRGHPELYTFASRDPASAPWPSSTPPAPSSSRRKSRAGGGDPLRLCRGRDADRRTGADDRRRPALLPRLRTGQAAPADRTRQARPAHLAWLEECLVQLLPVLERHGITLGMENLPSWEAVPNEAETFALIQRLRSPRLACWHDAGHGKIRENLGFVNVERWLERLLPHLAGMHVHDVAHRIHDHTMPPRGGEVDFARLSRFIQGDKVRVIEPTPRTPREEVVEALQFLQKTWSGPAPETQTTQEPA